MTPMASRVDYREDKYALAWQWQNEFSANGFTPTQLRYISDADLKSSNVVTHDAATDFVGELVDLKTIARNKTKQSLIALVRSFVRFGLSWSGDCGAKISPDTADAARSFIEALPSSKRFPKIAPDGEGNLMLIWEGDMPLLITVEDWHLHAVIRATTPEALYFDNVAFDGISIPAAMIVEIPTA